MTKEQKGISRREFLIGAGALVGSAVLSGCKQDKEVKAITPLPTERPTKKPTIKPTLKPTDRPPATEVPTKKPTEKPTLIPEPTPTKEQIIHIPGVTITEELLKKAFAGIGGGEALANGRGEETTLINFGQDYVSASWGEEVNFTTLSQDSLASLKYLVSLGAYQGKEGVYSPGKQEEEIIFPQLKDLSLARLTLDKVPSLAEQQGYDYQEWISPRDFLLYPETQMTVVGFFTPTPPEGAVVIDQPTPEAGKTLQAESKLSYAVVVFTDYLRASKEGVPRHYFAILPTHFPGDPENKNTLTLKNLLEANGYQYDPRSKEISFDNGHGPAVLVLNQIEGKGLIKDLRKAAGLYFVDQIRGKLIDNPIVPYPSEDLELPAYWNVQRKQEEDSTVFISLSGAKSVEKELTEIAQARYDEEKEEWVWEKMEKSIIESDFVGVEKSDLSQIEKHYLETMEVLLVEDRAKNIPSIEIGEILLPLPVDPKDVEEIEFLPYYQDSFRSFLSLWPQEMVPENIDAQQGEKGVELGYLALDLKPGAVVVAPFDGEMSWRLCETCNEKFLEESYERGLLGEYKPEDFYPGWKCYQFLLRTKLPSGRVLELSFYPGEAEILLPEDTKNVSSFPLRPVTAGTSLFRYIGSSGRETSPQVANWYRYYDKDEKGFIKKEVNSSLLIESRIGFIEDPQDFAPGFYGKVGVLANEEGKKIFVVSSQ